MDRAVLWGKLCALVSPVYPRAGNGRPPIDLEQMIRIHCLQHWLNLSDPAMEEPLHDSVSMRQFAGIDCLLRKKKSV
jgi:transposase, IS5 family